MLTDTRTVLKLLATVKRVVSKLKIELHQDYLSLGNINVGLVRSSSISSYGNLSNQTDQAHITGMIVTPSVRGATTTTSNRRCDKENNVRS